MALQHLFTRVPAKISMYNRADSYDTFARSENLSREFVEKELNTYSDIRLTMQESDRLRTEGLEPLYMCRPTKDGESYVESCVSFIPKDFTGERSVYFIHNLIMDDAETDKVFSARGANVFDAVNFQRNADKYNITDPEASPIKDLPELNLTQNFCSMDPLARVGDQTTMQRFIYCVLAVCCGKLKGLYFTLGDPDAIASEKALEFYNALMQIMPIHIRKSLSFMSRCSDPSRFTGVKIKCVSSECGSIPNSKGAAIKLNAVGQFSGVKDEDIASNFRTVDFIYSLIERADIRSEFISFADRLTKAVPSFSTLSLPVLNNMVLLFMACSGFFAEENILPNDNVMDEFYTIYEKAREGLSDQERINSLKSLSRYPKEHREISKTVFAKLSKIYNSEPPCTKVIIMDTVLQLIHTDVMREKLFRFIRDKYNGEEENVREKVNEDLCRVYYGGFLMPQILAFFNDNFSTEPDGVKTIVVDKVLLTIRTKSVAEPVLAFLSDNYQYFDTNCKARFYKAAVDNLKEGGIEAEKYLALINEKISAEDQQLKDAVTEYISRNIRAELSKKDKPIISLLAASQGFASDILPDIMFVEAFGSSAYKEYVKNMCKASIDVVAEKIFAVLESGKLSSQRATQFAELCASTLAEIQAPQDVLNLLAADELLKAKLQSSDSIIKAFAEGFGDTFLPTLMADNAITVFNHSQESGLAEKLASYGRTHDNFSASPNVLPVAKYLRLKKSIYNDQVAESFTDLFDLLKLVPAKKLLAYYKEDMQNANKPIAMFVLQYLEKGNIDLAECYVAFNSSENAINQTLALQLLGFVNTAAASNLEDLISVFNPDNVNAAGMFSQISQVNAKLAKKFFKEELKKVSPENIVYNNAYVKMAAESQGKKGLSLFKKK